MAEVLSQNEIDALLAAVSSGPEEAQAATPEAPQTGAGSDAGGGDWVAYDLTSQEKIVRGRLVALQGIHERFARLFRMTLSSSLKKSTSVNVTNTDFLRFGDYLSNILLPASLNIIEMTELKGFMLFAISSKLTYALVDAYYGGSERPFSKIGGREEFTSIENAMIRKFALMAVRDLEEAWKLNYPMKLAYLRSESNPHFVGSIHTSEPVAVVSFEVEFESLSGPFVMIVQLRALDTIQNALSVNVTGEVTADAGQWEDHWMKELMSMNFDIRAELGVTQRSLQEIQELNVGDVLILNQDAVAPLDIYVQDVPKLKGLMGVFRGNSAVRLTNDLATTEEGTHDGERKTR